LDELSSSLLRTLIPCIWCINDKKFEDPSFWKRAFLRRVTASEWEVLDELKDEVMDTLKWEGDNGLRLMWGFYAKTPAEDDVENAKKEAAATVSRRREEDNDVAVSPKRKQDRAKARENLQKQAKRMETRAKKADGGGEIQVGDVVLIPISDLDKCKLDSGNIVGVIVEKTETDYYRVVCKEGQLQNLYAYHRLTRLTGSSNDRKLHGLEEVYSSWRGLSKVSEGTVKRLISVVRGSKLIKCGCRSKKSCSTNSCACKAAGQFCSSRCHKGNSCCLNFDNSSLL
jgi:hypothetical protein